MIVSGGENVLPAEVEEVLLRHPDVADAAVVGRADPEWQEAVTAVVVLRDGAEVSAEELRAHCAAELAGFKVPKRVEFVVRAAADRVREADAEGAAMSIDRDARRALARRLRRGVEVATTAKAIGALFSEDVDLPLPPCATSRSRGRDAVVDVLARGGEPDDASAPTTPSTYERLRARGGRRRRRRGRWHQHLPHGSRWPVETVYDNCFVIRFDDDGRCRRVHRVVHEASPSAPSSMPRHA